MTTAFAEPSSGTGSSGRMRILVLNQYFHPDRSATSRLLTELCEDLSQHHEVYVVTGRPSYDPEYPILSSGLVSQERHKRVNVARVWSTSFDRSEGMPARLANYATYLPASLIGAMRVARPDVVVAMTDPPVVAVAAAAVSAMRRVPFVYVNQDVFPEVAVVLGRIRSSSLVRLLETLNRSLRRRAHGVIAIGRDMERRLAELDGPRSRVVVIDNWADGSVVRPLEGPSVLRAERGWDDRFVVMHSGNVGLSQSLGSLVAAADRLRDEDDIVFAIVGEGAAKAALQTDVRRLGLRNVEFLPTQPYETLSDSLGAADVHVVGLRRGLAGYIVPSKVYGIIAAGRPYVAAVEAGAEPALIAAEHGCGIRVEPDDPDALAEGILRMRESDLEEMGRNARKAFEERFDRPGATEDYRRILEYIFARSVALRGQRP
jgi:colanic acid biosynthesis glycosyl transferase WcaI